MASALSCADRVPPTVLPMRQRATVIRSMLAKRLEAILPQAMREAGMDMWLIICQEDNPDPVYSTLIPMDTWSPILQILVLFDRGPDAGVERINISGTQTHGLYDWPYRGQLPEEQWPLLRRLVEERNPQRIGINTGAVQWAAGGLTHNLYQQLIAALPAGYAERLVSAELAATRWLASLTDEEVVLYEHVVAVGHAVLAECFSRAAITPGVTTTDDLVWHYWQRCADLGLEVAFNPFFNIVRSQADRALHGEDDRTIRPGDCVHSDVGLRYLRLNTDHQQWAYVLRPGEQDAPEGLRWLMAEANRLQDVFMAEFRLGRTGNELLASILERARMAGIPNPRVYSHSLGLYLHEPGPLIGLPWEQVRCPGRGDVELRDNNAFTMELSVQGPVPEWGGQEVRMGVEEDVVFAGGVCRPIHGRQVRFHLV